MAFGGTGRPENRFKVNRALLPVKAHYFLFMAALSAALPFRTVFCKQLGVSATAVGVIFTAVPFTKLIANPIIGAILDYFKRFRLSLTLIMIIVATSHLAMVFVPPRAAKMYSPFITTANLSCGSRIDPKVTFPCPTMFDSCFVKSEIKSCSFVCEACIAYPSVSANQQYWNNQVCSTECDSNKLFQLTFDVLLKSSEKETSNIKVINESVNFSRTFEKGDTASLPCPCNGELQCFSGGCARHLNECAVSCDGEVFAEEKDDEVFISMQFWVLLVLMCISSVAFSAVMFIMDAATYEILNDKPHKYGEQRLWGTAGWGLGALAGGYLNQLVTGNSTEIDYSPGFYLLVALSMLDLLPLMKMEVHNVNYSSNILVDVGKLFCKLPVLFNIIMVYFIGVLSGLIWNYQFWFMEEIGSSQLLLGLSQTVECFLAEIPCFLIAGWVIKMVGHWNCMSITLICFGFRYLCFAYMKDPWLTLPVGLLHGPTFGLFYSSMTMYAKTEAPPGTEATVQALLSVAFEGVGAATGSILGGIGFDTIGSRTTFLYATASSFGLLILNVAIHLILLRKQKSDSSSKNVEEASSDMIPI